MLADTRNVLTTVRSQVITTAVICSFVFFLIDVLVGALCHHWATVFTKSCNLKHPSGAISTHTPTDTPDLVAPIPVVYEEVAHVSHSGQKIELKENVAYGPI